jgi:TM2 domain-containing membrane protein YozV
MPAGSKFCDGCGASLSAGRPPAVRTSSLIRETKNGGTAIVLSFFWTGLGQLYAGRIARGLVMMMVTPIVWAMGWFGGFAALVGGLGSIAARTAQESSSAAGMGLFGTMMALAPVVWWIWGIVDAKKLCEAFNRLVPG